MTEPKDLPYRISGRTLVHQQQGLRVQILSLEAGEEIPWHCHNHVDDIFVCQQGVTVIETKAPSGRHELHPGDHCTVPVKTAHRVTGLEGGRCSFTLIQGVGEHDYIPVGG